MWYTQGGAAAVDPLWIHRRRAAASILDIAAPLPHIADSFSTLARLITCAYTSFLFG
jgi:hypothetical protein